MVVNDWQVYADNLRAHACKFCYAAGMSCISSSNVPLSDGWIGMRLSLIGLVLVCWPTFH